MHNFLGIADRLVYFYGFTLHPIIGATICLYSFAVIMYIVLHIRKLLFKNFLYASNL